MSIKSKSKMTVEVLCFDNCAGQFMRIPFHDYDVVDWYSMDATASWELITDVLHLAELEAHWYDAKGGY